MNYWLGIDPGKKGSYCLLDCDGNIVKIDKLPTVKLKKLEIDVPALQSTLKEIASTSTVVAVLETSSAMPGQGVTSMFSFGRTYGIILASLYASSIPFIEVHPRTWTKHMYAGISGEGKERAYAVASKFFPTWRPQFKYEKDWADSILLAEYGRRYL